MPDNTYGNAFAARPASSVVATRPIPHRSAAFSGFSAAPAAARENAFADGDNSLDSEAWHACAGPLVCLPRVGDMVVYFPQGHIEQVVASTNQSAADLQIPHYDLPPQILCRVLNLSLGAYRETDEVYGQMTLVPETEELNQSLGLEEPCPASSKPRLAMFCKNLTSSDTSTHGGFSVPRRAAEECFPQLDYQQTPPAQELVAKDLHGIEWKFRHIYRGQPRRHLLTTGWSVFVSQKKLVAGDTILFVRGENGELRMGVRRANRPQSSVTSSSLLSSHSMQLGVLAAAAHAVSTKTMFTIFYNPRASPAEFVVPYSKYLRSFKLNPSAGMRFKMRFETEDSSERSVRYTGTITGIGDVDPIRWPNSKWRSLKVGWDEHAACERQERVSPWEMEPFIASNVSAIPVTTATTKRLRPTIGFRNSYNLSSSMHFQRFLPSCHDAQAPQTGPSPLWTSKCEVPNIKVNRENVMAVHKMFPGTFEDAPSLELQQQELRACVQQFREQKRANNMQPLDSALSAYVRHQSLEGTYRSLFNPLHSELMLPARTEANEVLSPNTKKEVTKKEVNEQQEKDCKLFGISLIAPKLDNPTTLELYSGVSSPAVKSSASQNGVQAASRTCTKVHKQGAVGRAVDLSKFRCYAGLLTEISRMFNIEEQLNESEAGWQAVYIDNEGDLLLVGDDPWEEFCNSVRSIRILSPAELHKMTQTTRSVTEEPSTRDVSRLSDQQDSSSSPPLSKSGDEA